MVCPLSCPHYHGLPPPVFPYFWGLLRLCLIQWAPCWDLSAPGSRDAAVCVRVCAWIFLRGGLSDSQLEA